MCRTGWGQGIGKSNLDVTSECERYVWFYCINPLNRGTRWLSRFRHCATGQKVAGSIPDDVNRIFH